MKIMEKVIRKKLNKKKYNWLITGSSGFIGTNLVIKLLDLKQKVVAQISIRLVQIEKSNLTQVSADLAKFQFIIKIDELINSNYPLDTFQRQLLRAKNL